MNAGVWLGTFLPWFHWGSHWLVNKKALHILYKEGISKADFVRLHDLNKHEGLKGLDGLWLKERYPASTMHYNPRTCEGVPHQEIARFALLLSRAYTQWPVEKNDVARYAAYVSHIVTDAFSPHHQYGKKKNMHLRWLFWNVNSDWSDELNNGKDATNYHFAIEIRLIFSIFGHLLKEGVIDYELLDVLSKRPQALSDYIVHCIEDIYSIGIYSEYIEKGWTKNVSRGYHEVVFPKAISVVSSIWYHVIKNQ